MSAQADSFRDFFDAMRTKKWNKARSFVVNNGDVRGGFSGETTSGVQEGGTSFENCVNTLDRLLNAFTVGKVSDMRVVEDGTVVTATYQVPITYNGGTFSYRGTPVTFSTKKIVAKVISKVIFDGDGKIVVMENRLTNERKVIQKLQDI